MMKRAKSINKRMNSKVRLLQFSTAFFLFLLLVPLQTPFSDPEFVDPTGIEGASTNDHSLAETSTLSGTGDSLPLSYSGIVTNVYDDTFIIDSSTSDIASVTIDDGWIGSGLQTTIDTLSMDVNDVRNSDMDTYHNEKFILAGETAYNSEDVTVPDSWTLTKTITGSGSEHPLQGVFEMNDIGSSGYSGTMGWRFDAQWTEDTVVNTDDQIYLSQQVHAPYRELYSAEITFYYYVTSSSSTQDQVYLFTRFNGYQTDFHVFESGDTMDTWLSASVTIPSAQLSSISMPNSILLEIGLQSNVDGSQSSDRDSFVYVDNVQLNLNVRPFPEQIDLKVNGTLVHGATEGSIYPYVPDDSNRDAADDPTNGIDLDGYSGGDLNIAGWGSGWTSISKWQSGFQFPLTIPQGAVITSAYVEVEPSTETDTVAMRIYASGQNSSSQPIENFTTGLPNMEDRFNWVDTSIDWTMTNWIDSIRIRQRSPDIAPLIQAVVSDSNWMSGEYTCIMLDYMWSNAYQSDWTIKGSSNYAQDELARLFVEYMIPESQDTVYLMQHEKDLSIDSNQVVSDLSDFPVLIELFDSDLKADVQSDGDDIVFRLNGEALDFEIELFDQSYNSSHAHLLAWVKIPSLSSTTDTTITMAYGNPDAPSSSSTAIWDDYATVHHLADDPSGTVYDSTSNNHQGTSYGTQGSEDSVSGLIGNSIDFDYLEDDVIGLGQIFTDDWDAVTMSIWAKLDVNRDCRVFSKSPSTTPINHILTMRLASRQLHVRIQTDGGSGASYSGNGTLNLGSWNLLTFTWSASSGNLLGYMNGTPVIDVSHTGTTITDSVDVFVLGNNNLNLAEERSFDGILDEARLSNSVLSEAWIQTEFNNQVDPSSFINGVSSERTYQTSWVDESKSSVVLSTTSPIPISTDLVMTMNIEGNGQSLDESYNPGSTFTVDNGSNKVDWTAYAMISPPNTTTDLNANIDYPFTQWNPVDVRNPLGQTKIYETDWDYQGGTITVYSSAVDYWGVWEFDFESWNYVEDVQVGISGQSLGDSATFDIGDTAAFRATTPWITDSQVGLTLTDPTGSVWHTASATTGTPGTTWDVPGFQYRMPLTISSSVVDADVTNYPLLVSFTDSDFQNTAKVQADGDDIVFVQNGIVLSHEIERFDQSSGLLSAWVKCNLSSTVSNSITLYYGNPVIGNTESQWDVWNGNFDAVYHLDQSVTNEGSGETIYDSTANNYTGTHNGTSRNTGRGGTYGQYFDGNDYISVSSTKGFDPSSDVTISGWFYVPTAFTPTSTSSMILVEKYLSGDDNFHIALAGTDYTESGFSSYGAMVFGFETATYGEYVKWTQRTTWNIGWYHFACVLDSDTPSNNKIYINGADNTDAGSSGGASATYLPSGVDWHIGGYQGESSEFPGPRYLTGNMDEIRISSGMKTSGWIAVEYDNINSYSTFVSEGSEVSKTSPELTITKLIDSTAPAGVWTATMHYNDSGSSVSNATGVYERNFIVKHDTTLTLNYPSDAVSDKTAYAVAGDPIYIEYELTDDETAGGVTGATVKLNWTTSGTPTEVTMDDLGDGRYGKTLDTDDLIINQQWRINIWSYHPYYNNDTDFFDLDLYHATNMTYKDVVSTPVGYDFKATLVFYDSYSDTPITGATITFDNGSAVSYFDVGGGEYGISISTTSLDYGDYWYRFKAAKAGSYLEDAYVNVTFTLRRHYTTVSVSGDLVTPSGFSTDLTVTIIDTDTGGTVSIGSVSSWTFDPASYSNTVENPPGDFLLTLDTTGWSLGTETVTLSVILTGDYYNPSNYDFDIEIRKHYTSVTVLGDFLTPHGYTTDVTVVLTDLDTGTNIVSTSDITSWLFDPASYSNTLESPPSDFDVAIDTSGWSVGTDTVTLSVVMGGIYENPSNYQFDIEIRRHYTSVTVSGDFITPYGQTTALTVTITDLDTGTELASTSSVSSWTFDPASYGDTTETPPSDFAVTLDTSSWSVGSDTVTLSVTMSGIYYNPSNYQFDIEIRNHRTTVSVIGEFVTASGGTSDVTVIITDLDTGTELASTSSVSSWTFDPAGYGDTTETPPGDFDVTLDSSAWSLGTETITLSVTMSGIYDSPSNVQFDIEIRKHYTSATVQGDLTTPYGFSTDLTIVITDIDLGTVLASTTNVASWTLNPASYSDTVETPPGDFSVSLDTTGWSVATETVTLTITMSGIYENPASYQFDIIIRNHYTAVSVSGDMVSPFGNTTDLNVIITDLDTNSVLGSTSNIASWTLNPASYGDTTETPPGDFAVTLDTSSWSVGTETVTLSVTMTGNYDDPSNYQFDITITHLEIDVVNEPNDLIFPTGSDFKIVVKVNITEPGIYYGEFVDVVLQTEFSVTGYAIKEWYNLGNGRYNFTIDEANFPEGSYTITLKITTTSNATIADATLQITFDYRPALSEASSPDRAAVTPYDSDFNVTITYTDIDRDIGITGASITAEGISFYNELELGGGDYQVTIDVSGLSKGEHLYNLTIDKAGYEAAKLSFKVVIRIAYTSAIPTIGALDIPVGDDVVFYVEYRDIDRDVVINDTSPFLATSTWSDVTFTYISGEERYRVDFRTAVDDALVQNLIVTFNFSKGENYQFGIFNISVTIRTHYTDFRLVSAIEPTSYNDNITISVFYGDLDSGTGIASSDIAHRVWNGTTDVTSYLFNDTQLGGGYYTIVVPAPQFGGLGLQSFTIYFNWTGPVYTYENSTIKTSANIIGEDSSLSLLVTAEPTPYLENMTYTLFFAAVNGTGIYNNSGNVFVSVSFVGYSVDTSQVDIWEIDPVSNRGEYSIRFNNTIFSTTGLIYMEVYFNWSKGVEPFYTNRTDTISVRVLARDTLISVDPPSQTAYAENTTFSFTYDDVTGALSEPIANDAALSFSLSLSDYSYAYDSPTRTFTVSFNTSQFGALGLQSFTLNITWVGAPFYANQSGKSISVKVTLRQTTLDFQSPSPTQYLDNVTFSVFWNDVAGASSVGIESATLTLYDGASPISTTYYSVTEIGSGEYEVELNTTYKTTPGTYQVTVNITKIGVFYLPTDLSTRSFIIRYRSTLVSSEPIDLVPYNSSIEIILLFKDLITLDDIGNDSFDVTLTLLTGGTWIVTSQWQSANSHYVVTVETYNQVGLEIGVQYPLQFNMSYADQSPYYNWDDITVYFELRYRESALERTEAPTQTPYDDFANFTVSYNDVDADEGIVGAQIYVYDGATPLTLSTEYLYTSIGNGEYEIAVLTSALGAPGTHVITIFANWTSGSPYHDNATRDITIIIIQRVTNVEIVTPPSQTNYLENITFIVSFIDLGTNTEISVTKDIVEVWNGGVQLSSADFAISPIGNTYEISINSTLLSSVLISNYNLTIHVDWPNAPDYYRDDSTSTRYTLIARSTYVSIDRPANTAYGENATFTFGFVDSTNIPEIFIPQSNELTILSNLSETPSLSFNAGTGLFEMSFDTSQFGVTGTISFHLNVSWAGSPYYSNKSLQAVRFTITYRQTQVDFQAPVPTPYGDNVTFTIWFLDISGATETGISDATLTLYYLGSPIPTENYDITPGGDGSFVVELYTGYFTDPGTYNLNASFVYEGVDFKEDNYAIRPLSVRYRTTVLSADPIGSVGYETQLELTLYYQDQLTLANIANSSSTFMEILNDTGTPWEFTISWNVGLGQYDMTVETSGQPLSVGITYSLHLNMTNAYQSPFYRWDNVYVQFTIRTRTTSLDVFEGAQPTSYNEYINFTLYYWDVDVTAGINSDTTFTVENETHTLVLSSDFIFNNDGGGYYLISVNASSLSTLSLHELRITALWTGGAPFRNNAVRNITVSVIERTSEVEIISPPSSTPYLDNVTFTFRFTDTVDNIPISDITSNDILIYSNGTLLAANEFVLIQISQNFEVSINSTILSNTLVDGFNITIVIDWNEANAPYYEDATTALRVSTRSRPLFVEVGTIETTPRGDNMTISFSVSDDATGKPVSGAVILFNCQTADLTGLYTLTEGTGVNAGAYNITFDTESFVFSESDLGDFKFDLDVRWNATQEPYYRNRSTIVLTGAVDLIWSILQTEVPNPSSVQITGNVSVIVEYIDQDHGTGITGASVLVSYTNESLPFNLISVVDLLDGRYNITFSTEGLPTSGTFTLNVTATKGWHTLSEANPSFNVIAIATSLVTTEAEITLPWSEDAFVEVTLQNLLYGNNTPEATVTWELNGSSGNFNDVGSGLYSVYISTLDVLAGTRTVRITATKDGFQSSTATVTLVIQPLPSDMTLDTPAEATISLPRGNPQDIAVYLNDTYNGGLISDIYVQTITVTFEGQTWDLVYSPATSTYNFTLPTSATADLIPGDIYSVRISASNIRNYDSASTIFKIFIETTETTLSLYGDTTEEMNVYYSEVVTFTLKFNTTVEGIPVNESEIYWVLEGFGRWNFSYQSPGIFHVDFNTTVLGYGTWGLTFRGFPDDTNLASDSVTLTLIIRNIPTKVENPDQLSKPWGWSGYVYFYFNDTYFNEGISNATSALYEYGGYKGNSTDMGDGNYSIFIDTTLLNTDVERYTLRVEFLKANYFAASGGIDIIVEKVPTEIVLSTPELNWDPARNQSDSLIVPIGDVVEIGFYYNDIDNSEGYTGGLAGADTLLTIWAGATVSTVSITDLIYRGDGLYAFTFDTTDTTYFEGLNFTPQSVSDAYRLRMTIELQDREAQSIDLTIRIIDRPTNTEFVSTNAENGVAQMDYGGTLTVTLSFTETWAPYLGDAIVGAAVSAESSAATIIYIDGNGSTSTDGEYFVTLRNDVLPVAVGLFPQTVEITIQLYLDNYDSDSIELRVTISPTETQTLTGNVVSYGTPLIIIFLILGFAWVRVFSVPKRLRQINGQIKALRKGKIPNPVAEAKSRQELLAELFIDTNKELEITRTPDQMPEESVPVDIPEMGELLIQLSILTNLSPEELDEFKADISKMKMSEQAAFVKEVIDQEAIRASRRDGISMEEVLEKIEKEAKLRVSGEELDETVVTKTVADEPIFLTPKETIEDATIIDEPDVIDKEKPDIAREIRTEEPSITEKLSDYEIEELKKDLQKQGVEPHEIDTILEQARELPRELVEELLRSLGVERE